MPHVVRLALTSLLAVLALSTSSVAEEDVGWPREVEHEKGTVIFYQPQIETFENNDLTARSAFSVTTKENPEPVFGVMWVKTRVSTDRDNRTVDIIDLDVTDVRFPGAKEEAIAEFAGWVEAETETWELTISLDRVLTNLAIVEQEKLASEDLKVDPPVVLYADYPAVLIMIDGEPRFAPLPEDDDLKRVVNTPYRIVMESKKHGPVYWLDGGTHWYRGESIEGPWSPDNPPKRIRKLRSDEEQKAADEAAKEAKAQGKDEIPKVIVATVPTELVITEGPVEYRSIVGTDLLVASNTDNDLLKHVGDQKNYLLLSGRWYTSSSLDGPWTYVRSDELPDDFARIPAESDDGDLLVFVAGTQQAREAIMDSQIPQTAAVQRGPGKVEVEYDGDPKFEPIEGTEMQYAVNTASAVLLIDGKYWLCEQAVWYVAPSAQGPWEVATSRPDDVEQIPPSNPHYNVKYVYVYDSTPDVVYTGYTSGYVSSYHHHGCMVYGTGWWYRPWYGRYYYPYHSTWGFRVHYNPWYGWSFGISWSNGPFTISIGRGGGWWGPRGPWYRPVYRPGRPIYRPPYRPGYPGNRPGTRPPARGTRPSTKPANAANNLYNRPEQKANIADRSTKGKQPGAAAGDRANNVYAGNDGNVYRRNQDGSWQQRDGNNWKSANPGGGGTGGGDRPSSRPSQPSSGSPSTKPSQPSYSSPSTKPSQPSSSNLNRDYGARQRGNSRTNSYNRSRGSYGGYGGGRGRMGGGRRR